MAEQTYNFEINAFLNNKYDMDKLTFEIEESDIAIGVSYMNGTEGDLDIIFRDTLSVGDHTILNGIVDSHDGIPLELVTAPIVIGGEPNPADIFWLNPENKMIYIFDELRNIWQSTHRGSFSFARKGNADGMYLPPLGDLDSVDDVYMSGNNAAIVSVFCKSVSGDKNKEFEIRINKVPIYSFSYSDNLIYSNNKLNIPIGIQDRIQVYVVKAGDKIKNTLCRLEIAWWYDA